MKACEIIEMNWNYKHDIKLCKCLNSSHGLIAMITELHKYSETALWVFCGLFVVFGIYMLKFAVKDLAKCTFSLMLVF